MRDYDFFTELANVYLTELDAIKSPWPLMLLASVHALIWLVQVIGCAVDSLDGELHYRLCGQRAGVIQIHRHDLPEDGNSDLLLIEHQLGVDLQPLGCARRFVSLSPQ